MCFAGAAPHRPFMDDEGFREYEDAGLPRVRSIMEEYVLCSVPSLPPLLTFVQTSFGTEMHADFI